MSARGFVRGTLRVSVAPRAYRGSRVRRVPYHASRRNLLAAAAMVAVTAAGAASAAVGPLTPPTTRGPRAAAPAGRDCAPSWTG